MLTAFKNKQNDNHLPNRITTHEDAFQTGMQVVPE